MEQTNLFETKTAEYYITRINSLSSKSVAQWGKMNVAQMLHHCQKPFKMANGSLDGKTNAVFKFFFGRSSKNEMLNKPGFRKNLPTFKELIVSDSREFEKEKAALIDSINNFKNGGESAVTNKPHGLFGNLTVKEWNILLSKHLDHHLSQFGA